MSARLTTAPLLNPMPFGDRAEPSGRSFSPASVAELSAFILIVNWASTGFQYVVDA